MKLEEAMATLKAAKKTASGVILAVIVVLLWLVDNQDTFDSK